MATLKAKDFLPGQIRDDSVPDVDDDRNSLPPPLPKLLKLEVEAYEKMEKAMERAGYSKSDTALIFMEVAVRKDLYRVGTGAGYEHPLEMQNSGEKVALIKLFNSLKGHRWTRKFGWVGQGKTSSQPEVRVFAGSSSLYEGLSVKRLFENTGLLTDINLMGVGCDGELPEAVESLETVKTMTLSWNEIHGRLPLGLQSMHSLLTVDLSGNKISGELCGDVFQPLKHVKTINLSSNLLSGGIPDAFAEMKQLTILDLSNNHLSGPIPSSLAHVGGTLEELKLQQNQLSGELPEWFSSLVELKNLNLCENHLTGRITPVWSCIKMQRLILSGNDFVGPLMDELGGLGDLRILYLHRNRLRGCIPKTLCRLHKLRRLNISYNNLRGSLPPDLGSQLSRLESLVAEGNNLTGPAPDLSSLKRLRDYSLFKNVKAENGFVSRGFRRSEFERMYDWGPAQGLNSLVWHYETRPGAANPAKDSKDRFYLFDQRLHRDRKQYS